MAKRITESRLKTAMIAAGVVGVPLGIYLIIYLVTLGAIDVLSYSGDIITNDDTVFINVTFKVNEDIFIYPMDSKFALETDNPGAIKLIKTYRTWGSGLRQINLSKTCTGSWCGCYWCTKYNTAKYVYVLRKGREYTFVYEIQKTKDSIIKWSWLDGTVDPFVVGYEYTYKTYNKKIPIYSKIPYNTSIECGKDKTGCDCNLLKNGTTYCSKTIEKISQPFSHYNYKKIETKERIGVKLGTKEYLNNNGININEKDGNIEQCNVPLGDRNWKEYPLKQYEIDKGFCWKTKLNIAEIAAEMSR